MTLHELWDDLVPPERRWLGVLILASLLAHTLFFFIFRIKAPESSSFPLRPAQVFWMSTRNSGSLEGNLIWLDWRDPSAIALPKTALPRISPSLPLPELPDRYQNLQALSGGNSSPFWPIPLFPWPTGRGVAWNDPARARMI
ncbi:MAG: hypothetical protein HC904_09355 [Blastochloris sp.]|nr:hypothetical protein [Blastochloris sp.]